MVAAMALILVATAPTRAQDPPPTPPAAPAAPSAPAQPAQPAGGEHVLVGAGDIAKCEIIGGAAATARVLDRIPGTVFTAGDNAYEDGSEENFAKCYEPTWGRHKARTRPSLGNHDLKTDNGGPYYRYFGENAGPVGKGYYSYDLGDWHIVVLNSAIDIGPRSEQGKWLSADLAANPRDCILAYWHIPLFSSGPHGNDRQMRALWEPLFEAGADVIINGHDHMYERFAPMRPDGKADPERGIRQFVVGTGGGGVYRFKGTQPNSEVRDNTTYGVIKMTLSPGAYKWEYIPGTGKFTDSGSGVCSPAPAR
jgi:hypothetical protein